ncbi:glycosyltransferase [Eisenibacter elegans]|uniref:glycosyltransferase n=1 Tax=Eisenibacter elegans TaxID=997 RepID=UPI0009D6FC2B
MAGTSERPGRFFDRVIVGSFAGGLDSTTFRMRILYLHQYFKTYADGGATRSYYVAQEMVARGWEVVMITSHNKPRYEQRFIEGIEVHYLPIYYANHLGKWARIWAFARFMWQSFALAMRLPRFEHCWASSTPLSVGVTALLIKQFRGLAYSIELRDWWPEVPIQLGVINKRLWITLLKRVEKLLYQNAQNIITLSPEVTKALAQQGIPQEKLHFVPNMADIDFFASAYKPPRIFEKYNSENPLLVGYFGAMGPANGLKYYLKQIAYCQAQCGQQVRFFLVGEGKEKEALMALSKRLMLENVEFIPKSNKFEIREMMAQVQAIMVSFAPHPILQTTSPNKFFDGLAAGKLCIVNVEGWLQDLVEKYHCGIYINPLDEVALYQQLAPFLADTTLLIEAQRNALTLGKQVFSRKNLTKNLLKCLEK